MRRVLPYIFPGAITVVALLVFLIAVPRIIRGPQPPLSYTETTYQAERPIYAPGETLVYTAALTIERYGGVKVIRGWRTRPGSGRAILCDGTNAPVIEETPPPFPPAAVGNEVEGRIRIPIPELPPGDYWLVSSVYKLDGGEAVTQVPISVVRPCGDGSR